jgi:hypothetical protein
MPTVNLVPRSPNGERPLELWPFSIKTGRRISNTLPQPPFEGGKGEREGPSPISTLQVSSQRLLKPCSPRGPPEPILIPRLQIDFADFPDMHYARI